MLCEWDNAVTNNIICYYVKSVQCSWGRVAPCTRVVPLCVQYAIYSITFPSPTVLIHTPSVNVSNVGWWWCYMVLYGELDKSHCHIIPTSTYATKFFIYSTTLFNGMCELHHWTGSTEMAKAQAKDEHDSDDSGTCKISKFVLLVCVVVFRWEKLPCEIIQRHSEVKREKERGREGERERGGWAMSVGMLFSIARVVA